MSTDIVPKFKFPKSLGACADQLFEVRARRYAQQKLVDALEAEEKALKTHLIEMLPKTDTSGVAGKVCRVQVIVKEVPQAEDWAAVQTYIKKNNAFDLLQRRLSDKAIIDRWDAGKEIPGIAHFQVASLSIHQLKG